MTLAELMLELREDIIEDSEAPYQWSDKQLIRYLNEGAKEACLRSPLYKDNQTVSVIAGTASYTLDDETLEIDEITLALQEDPLIMSTQDQMEIRYGLSWRETTGTPLAFVRKDLTITLYPEPIVSDTMTINAFRVPEKMTSASNIPEFLEYYHQSLLYWAAYKAFLNPDIDQGNVDRAMSFLSMFERFFGPRKSAKYDAIQRNTPKYHSAAPRRMA